jgi:hypothetical protein
MMCHGAGITHPTLSDLVAEVEYVDANGELQTVSDPELLKTAAGCFGLLGVVTSFTVRLPKMTYAAMRPYKAPLELAIPPPDEYIVAAKAGDPAFKTIREMVDRHSQAEFDAARDEFIKRSENDYYSEWFWFPLQSDVWINTWNNDGDVSVAKDVPSDFETFLQWLEEWFIDVLSNWVVWQVLPGEVQAKLLGFFALIQLPNVVGDDPSRMSCCNGVDGSNHAID